MPPQVIYLTGDLGVGKTTLVRKLLRAWGYQQIVKSPSFTIIETYPLPDKSIHHLDLYRLADSEELEYIGLSDYLTDDAILLIEWPEHGAASLPDPTLSCKIEILAEEHQRLITLNGEEKLIELCADTLGLTES